MKKQWRSPDSRLMLRYSGSMPCWCKRVDNILWVHVWGWRILPCVRCWPLYWPFPVRLGKKKTLKICPKNTVNISSIWKTYPLDNISAGSTELNVVRGLTGVEYSLSYTLCIFNDSKVLRFKS